MASPKALDAFATLLSELDSAGGLPASRLSPTSRRRLQPLFDSGVLIEGASGAGRRITVEKPEVLRTFIKNHYPSGLVESDSEGRGSRTLGVHQYRNSKATGGLGFQFVTFRTFGPEPFYVFCNGGWLDATTQAAKMETGSLVLRGNEWPRYSGQVATVENPEFFMNFDWQSADIGLVIFTNGRMSGRLIDWLASDSMEKSVITHFGDYDPTGIDEFLKLSSKLGSRAKLYRPVNLEYLFSLYARRDLLSDSGEMMHRLSSTKNSDAKEVIRLMTTYDGGLEQEALLGG